jgi:uncharacterized protein
LTKRVQSCLSDEIFAEYIDVLNREKFSRVTEFKTKSEVVLSKLREISFFYRIETEIDVLEDASDNKFLDLALTSSADYLVTGNTSDFKLRDFEHTKILTPREYWDNFAPQQ